MICLSYIEGALCVIAAFCVGLSSGMALGARMMKQMKGDIFHRLHTTVTVLHLVAKPPDDPADDWKNEK